MSSSVLIVNLAVLFAVLEADLGHRVVSRFRVLRPLLLAAGLVPLFIEHPATAGRGAVLELTLTALGVVLGLLAATKLMSVASDPAKGQPVSSAGAAYAAFWCVIIGARLAFTYGANHWFTTQLGHWLATNAISADALTDALIFMALAMTVTRSLRLAASRIGAGHGSAHNVAVRA